jgi:septal ring factor EnvC (AmiA/AmiB activator)
MKHLKAPAFIFGLMSSICWAVFLALLAIHPAFGSDAEGSRDDLQEIQRRIRQVAAGLEKKQSEEKDLKSDLSSLDREMDRLVARGKKHKEKLAELEQQERDLDKKVADSRLKSRQRREMVKKRLSVMYRGGRMRLLRVLFSGNSPSSSAEEYFLLKKVVQHDRELLEAYRRDREELNRNLEDLERIRKRRQGELERLERSRRTLADGQKLKKRMLARLRRQQTSMTNELAKLKEKAARLQSLVKRLESAKPREYTDNSGIFARQKGHLLWPVNGAVKVGFGTCRLPRLGTLYDCQGIEIETPLNQPIRASWQGTVIFAKPFKGYGNLIIIDHGDNYYTLYAQASRLLKTVGEKVAAGDKVAYSGFEGVRTVYFEIRHRGTPQDPIAWLKPHS